LPIKVWGHESAFQATRTSAFDPLRKLGVVAAFVPKRIERPPQQRGLIVPPAGGGPIVGFRMAVDVDEPEVGNHGHRVHIVTDKSASGLTRPSRERAVLMAPSDIVAAISVEVARANHLPAGRDCVPGVRTPLLGSGSADASSLCYNRKEVAITLNWR
jgi:hypothetical protein